MLNFASHQNQLWALAKEKKLWYFSVFIWCLRFANYQPLGSRFSFKFLRQAKYVPLLSTTMTLRPWPLARNVVHKILALSYAYYRSTSEKKLLLETNIESRWGFETHNIIKLDPFNRLHAKAEHCYWCTMYHHRKIGLLIFMTL